MGRKKMNKYLLVAEGLRMEKSIDAEFCQTASQKEIIENILMSSNLPYTLDSYRKSKRKIELVPLRVHKEDAE